MTALLTLTRDEAIELHARLLQVYELGGFNRSALGALLTRLEQFIAGTAPERLETQDDPGDIHSVRVPGEPPLRLWARP